MAAAQLLTSDHHAVIRRQLGFPLMLLAASIYGAFVAPRASAAGWTPCNAPDLEPPATVEREAPPYPESARLAGAEGFVDVAFTVLRDGRVGWARVLRAEPSGFFEATALDGVRDWRFAPARRGGEPVECRIQTRVRFTLTDTVAARTRGAAAPPTTRPAPFYPEQARIDGLEGYVEVAFTVRPDGSTADARVTLAMPRGDFESAALSAVRDWTFPPDPEGPRFETRRFEFSLPDSYPRPPATTLLAAAPLPAEACTKRIAGRVTLEVDTDGDGRITAARILASQPVGLFDAAALAIARNSRMAPAWRGGVPIAATGLLTLEFEPDAAHCPEGRSIDGPGTPANRPVTPRVSGIRAGEHAAR